MSKERIGNIKDYTPNYKLIIPRFDIATWHDYIEENFRNIDALFFNLFGINNYSGSWKQITEYKKGQVLFIGDDLDINGNITKFSGRLVKVLVDHVTDNSDYFNIFYNLHPEYYELFTDASTTQAYANLAKDWANKVDGTVITPQGDDTGEYSAKKYAQDSQNSATDAEQFKILTETNKNIAQEAAASAKISAQNSETSAQKALVSEQNSKTSETNAKISEQNSSVSEQKAKNSENNAKIYETKAANTVEILTNNFNSYNNRLISTTNTGVSELTNTKTSSIVELDNKLSNALNEINSKTNVLDKTMITNCITEIPQDIKLEIANNQFVAKAGSKALIPNGFESDGVTPKFDEFIINSDLSANIPTGNFTQMIFVRTDNTITIRTAPLTCFSGASAPSGYANMAWYDTTNNLMKLTADSGSTWTTGFSLPLGIYTTKADYIATIDQVFNGFGYIGSTVYVLPGVKGLIPNGRNADGSLKNIEFVTQNVITRTFPSTENRTEMVLGFDGNYLGRLSPASFSYLESENINKNILTGEKWDYAIVSKFSSVASGVITSFTPKQTFQAVDRNDSSWLSGLGMPSDKYINLTLGASGTSYTMLANGYLSLEKGASTNQNVFFTNRTLQSVTIAKAVSVNNASLGLFAPVKKGDTILVSYSASGTTSKFRFYYAEGENN